MIKFVRTIQSAAIVVGAVTLASAAAPAQTPPTKVVSATEAANAGVYWTAERLRAARPMAVAVSSRTAIARSTLANRGPSAVIPGHAPMVEAGADEAEQLFEPAPSGSGVSPALVGTGALPYTVNRLYPVRNTRQVYPYGTVGQLFFTIPGSGDFVCTASVIRERVIATAGHCVADGHSNFYSNWLFVPGEWDGTAPFLKWSWSQVTTTNNWFSGGGTVPNIQDDALIVLADQVYRGAVHRIGEIVGYLGFEYNAALPTHITQLGYPCNLDGCAQPIATYAQLYNAGGNNFDWGTAQLGGSSGGPEIQDFGVAPSGTPAEIFGGNIVVSVTSYLFTNPNVEVEGGSIFGAPGQFSGNTFGDLINSVCSVAGNC